MPDVIKATFKARHKKQLDFILQMLLKSLGQQNIRYLTPTYIYRAKIYVLDMDIRISDALLKSRYQPSPNKGEGQVSNQFNSKVVISSGNFDKMLKLFTAMKEDIEKRFGKEAIVYSGFNNEPAKNGYYYADFFLSIPEVG